MSNPTRSLLLTGFLLLSAGLTFSQDLSHENYLLYRQFYFADGKETGPMLARIMIGDSKTYLKTQHERVKRIEVDTIGIVNTDTDDNNSVLSQLLLSLDVYNLWFSMKKRRGSVDTLSYTSFFKGRHPKRAYKTERIENGIPYGKVVVKKLGTLTTYNFGGQVHAEFSNGRAHVYFPPSELTLTCSRAYYDELLFPRYLNNITTEPMLTGYQITTQKLDLRALKNN